MSQYLTLMVPIAPQRLSGLGGNPIPCIYVIIAASHCGFMLPSSAGSSAVADGMRHQPAHDVTILAHLAYGAIVGVFVSASAR